MTDMSGHHAAEIVRAHQRLDAHSHRLHQLELSEASNSEWRTQTAEKLDDIKSGVTWINRLLWGGLITAVLAFIVAGGLIGTAQ